MAMTPSGMAAAVKAEIIATLGPPEDEAALDNFIEPFCKGIVEYIQANAEVSVTGVQPGAGTASGTVG